MFLDKKHKNFIPCKILEKQVFLNDHTKLSVQIYIQFVLVWWKNVSEKKTKLLTIGIFLLKSIYRIENTFVRNTKTGETEEENHG